MMSLSKYQLAIVFSIFMLFFSGPLKAQERIRAEEKLSVNIGVASPGVFLLGFRALSDQHEIGGTFGIFPNKLHNNVSMSVDYTYHFGGNSKLTTRKPWYFRVGLDYSHFKVKECYCKPSFLTECSDCIRQTKEMISLNPKIGKEINFSSNFGLQIDFGVFILLDEREFDLSGAKADPLLAGDAYPSVNINLFYKI